MTGLREVLRPYVSGGAVPGAVALVARGDRTEAEATGSAGGPGSAPVAQDSLFRIASLTKPLIAAAAMMLIEDGRMALGDPVKQWLPELASPVVVRTPDAAVDDVVPAARPITVEDLLTFRAGYGFPADFSLPAVVLLHQEAHRHLLAPQQAPLPDAWLADLARIPMLRQPGEAWLYQTCSDILGVLIARAAGRSLPAFLAERLFEPLGMADTGFSVPAADLGRFTTLYRPAPEGGEGGPEPVDPPDGEWSRPPAFPAAGGGLVSTAGNLYAFARMLLAGGTGPGGQRLLSPASVRRMTTDHLTPAQREGGALFLEGQGWGYGGSVDITAAEPWNVPGRYGWVGGTGTAAHIVPSTGLVAILLTQVLMTGPTPSALMRDFWRYAAGF
ncbi:serine hydrolase domain-containing protein [Streptomyces hiroshimensis]|uniref:Serine hydrolase n=1 Tax=Streptomyces hiroshimensis TaxID=66424 RepID=A0ABQ2Y5W1_9ACTN|nr:serine hydrolase domain-containing protein [Streptomyces hiroshimensis]GGX65166.1 serine hydrolase [Streptomyces hiroshimensis]